MVKKPLRIIYVRLDSGRKTVFSRKEGSEDNRLVKADALQ